MTASFAPGAEWLETDGLGGFASGTTHGFRTRRYHALLLAAATPPTNRFALVNGLDVQLEVGGHRYPLSAQYYAPDVSDPPAGAPVADFTWRPWPTWSLQAGSDLRIEQELLVVHGTPLVVITWSLERPGREGEGGAMLLVRPLISGRDYHALHHENPAFRFEGEEDGDAVRWRPYPGVPGIEARSNGAYTPAPLWFRDFLYTEERARGQDDREDLASPGVFRWDLSAGKAVLTFEALLDESGPGRTGRLVSSVERLRTAERRRRAAFPSALHRAADDYVVARGAGKTIVAGYPWFADWGRDTLIAMRGLCLAAGRLDDAKAILSEWAGAVSEGMLPNRFPDRGDEPEFNAVDASLWFIVAVHDYLAAARAAGRRISKAERARLDDAVHEILTGYSRGTRYGIAADRDGLLMAGEPGVQLTWMDAKVGDWVVTPRIGKPVEVQALWLNALRIGSERDDAWRRAFDLGMQSFDERFWDDGRDCLHDVVDADRVPGAVDRAFRPNQIFAVGGLPYPLLDRERARRVVDAVEARLLIPIGLRSLAPDEPGYRPRYEGDQLSRDSAYHQGTVWPWLLGPFAEAWVRVRGNTARAKRDARRRFLTPLLAHLEEAGLGHISEIADGDPPYRPNGCPFQAWSVGEALRLDRVVLAERAGRSRTATKTRAR